MAAGWTITGGVAGDVMIGVDAVVVGRAGAGPNTERWTDWQPVRTAASATSARTRFMSVSPKPEQTRIVRAGAPLNKR